jgi:hypothetical protein
MNPHIAKLLSQWAYAASLLALSIFCFAPTAAFFAGSLAFFPFFASVSFGALATAGFLASACCFTYFANLNEQP